MLGSYLDLVDLPALFVVALAFALVNSSSTFFCVYSSFFSIICSCWRKPTMASLDTCCVSFRPQSEPMNPAILFTRFSFRGVCRWFGVSRRVLRRKWLDKGVGELVPLAAGGDRSADGEGEQTEILRKDRSRRGSDGVTSRHGSKSTSVQPPAAPLWAF